MKDKPPARSLLSAILLAISLLFLSPIHADEGACRISKPVRTMAVQLSHCDGAEQYDDNKLRVAIRQAPPFIYEKLDKSTGEPRLEGIAIDLWEEIGRRLDIDYRYICLGLNDTLVHLEAGTVDVAISPLTITKSREEKFDFSHQYFNSGLVFASQPGQTHFDFDKALDTLGHALTSDKIFYLFMVFALLLVSLIILALKNIKHYQTMPSMAEKPKALVVLHVVLYSILNISGIRKDVFGFSTIGMQLFCFIILIFGITMSASLFGMVAAALNQSVAPKQDFSLKNIDQHRVVTMQNSTAQRFLCDDSREKNPKLLQVEGTWQDAIDKVVAGEQDLVLGDWVQLIYLSRTGEYRNSITVHDKSFQFEPYGWGIKNNSQVKDAINQELIDILRSQTGPEIVRRYIGDNQMGMQVQ